MNGIRVYDDQLLEEQRRRYAVKNVHEAEEEDLFIQELSQIPHAGSYINIGTAIGYYAFLAKKNRPDLSIHCFEPLPLHIQYFKENIELNRFPLEAFHIHPVAISTSSGTVRFKDETYGSSVVRTNSSLLCRIRALLNRNKPGTDKIIKVRSISMSKIWSLTGLAEIDFVQMDVQGFENEILSQFFADRDAWQSPVRSFLIGTHSRNLHAACRKLFTENGYTVIIDEYETSGQPDGILLARMLSA